MSQILASVFFLFLSSPILYIIYKFGLDAAGLFNPGLFWALKNSLIQGLISSALCILGGVLFSRGLQKISDSMRARLRFLALIPMLLPSLFSVLVAMNVLWIFPYGHWGVIFVYVLIYLGYATFFIYDCQQKQLNQLGFLAEVYGLNRWSFFRRVYFKLMQMDLFSLFIFIFTCTLASLTVPMMAGGGRGTNFEVYLYEKIYLDAQWSSAAVLLLFQLLAMLILSRFVGRAHFSEKQLAYIPSRYLSSKTSLYFFVAYLLVYFIPISIQMLRSIVEADLNQIFVTEILNGLRGSLQVYLGLIILFFLFVFKMSFYYFYGLRMSYFRVFQNMSAVVVGFASLIFWPKTGFAFSYFSVLFCASFIYFLGLYFTYFDPIFRKMQDSFLTAQIYHIPFRTVFKKIIWPQIKKPFSISLGLLALIVSMDFVFVFVSGATYTTLGTVFESYLSSYRMSMALVVAAVGIVFSLLVYLLMRFVYVDDKKSEL